MSLETWIAFVLASALVVLIPGPNIVLTINHAVRSGKRSGLATIPGISAGAFFGMSVSLMGAGAVLSASTTLFTLMKLIGAVYLVWLGINLWRAPAEGISSNAVHQKPLKPLFWQSFLISALNPKGPAFYIAFVPQFVTLSQPVLPQFAILIATFVGVATLNTVFWLLCADGLRGLFQHPRAMRSLNRVGGGCLMAAGVLTTRVSRHS